MVDPNRTPSSAAPRASVVIVTSDRKVLMERALKSVVDQDYRPLEVVVVDNSSQMPVALEEPDGSDVRIRVIRLDERLKSGGARNVGVRAASGAFVSFLDDDDYFLEGKLARECGALIEDPSIDLVFSPVDVLDRNGNFVERLEGLPGLKMQQRVHLNGVTARRSALDAIPFEETLPRHIDTDFNFRAFAALDWRRLDDTGAVWIRAGRSDQITRSSLLSKALHLDERLLTARHFTERHDEELAKLPFLRSMFWRQRLESELLTLQPIAAFQTFREMRKRALSSK